MTPEERARHRIDKQLDACGWIVHVYRQMYLSAGLEVAVREFPFSAGEADYLLYADCHAISVLEANPEGHPLTGIGLQSEKYIEGLPAVLPHYRLPLSFAYGATGIDTAQEIADDFQTAMELFSTIAKGLKE